MLGIMAGDAVNVEYSDGQWASSFPPYELKCYKKAVLFSYVPLVVRLAAGGLSVCSASRVRNTPPTLCISGFVLITTVSCVVLNDGVMAYAQSKPVATFPSYRTQTPFTPKLFPNVS